MGSGRKDLLEEGCGQNRKPQVAHERALPPVHTQEVGTDSELGADSHEPRPKTEPGHVPLQRRSPRQRWLPP